MASHLDRYIRIARTRACTRTVYTSGEQGRELQFAVSIRPGYSDRHRAHVIDSGAHVQLRPAAGTKRARAVGCN